LRAQGLPQDKREMPDQREMNQRETRSGPEGARAAGSFAGPVFRWLGRTPVQTFVICPLVVIAVELALGGGKLTVVPWGLPLMAWGFLQYLLIGRYRLGLAGGGPGIETPPQRILARGPYRFVRNPMYLGHLIYMAGLALSVWSWFALILLAARAVWFHARVLRDETRLMQLFGADYLAYCARVKRWVPGLF
jgi:protein-S-isoprenylcysteine O-methyltransferase Ste14